MRITPLAVDDDGNKFWYFGDTYLFLERHKSDDKDETSSVTSRKQVTLTVAVFTAQLQIASEQQVVGG